MSILSLFMGKNVYAVVGLVILAGTVVTGYKMHEARKIAAAVEAAKAAISAGAVEAVTKTAAAEREATDNTPLPADKQAIVELCKRSASCKERRTLK
jgi:predicted membrane-bound mannosyltransferase